MKRPSTFVGLPYAASVTVALWVASACSTGDAGTGPVECSVPLGEIVSGGVGRDAISAQMPWDGMILLSEDMRDSTLC